ncbi:hypothetical protein AUEXF2481DRAFT_6977 [Aureobasidium subglaciale EXF-2481]|uniref:beta-glucosidase n=1 Tax=Aureobasidium subglaciale (strain EXF-2481) TaxID=1043005 RepID=A0A074Y5D6_AURSE|nr:uncharacterized protein AUEXF2481DRAFT_6977 [Aureobasidium subglaciale EXF-2481]KEQ93013.1 hypothetical protein AUEXF2481DRAFT_6977 [Aureobasidium subglaciale EXF-2481]
MAKYRLEDPNKVDSVQTVQACRYMSLGQAPSSRVFLEGIYTPGESGCHQLELSSIGFATLSINDTLVACTEGDTVDPVAFLQENAEGTRESFTFGQGRSCLSKLEVRQSPNTSGFLLRNGAMGISLGLMEQSVVESDLLAPAVEAARNAEVAVAFVGNTTAWESEDRDMDSTNLPVNNSQDELVAAVAEANPNTIVVISTGVPVVTPWISSVKAVIQT